MTSTKDALLDQAPPSLKRALELAFEWGASDWFTVLPVQENGVTLHKTDFHDAIALQYGWDPVRLPDRCPCGVKFSVDMHFLALKVDFQLFDTIKYVI